MELFTLGLGFLYACLSAKHPLHHSYSVKPSRHSEVRTYWDTSIFTYDYIWYVTSKIQNEKIWLILIHFTTPQSDQRHLWPLRHVIRVMRRHDPTNKWTVGSFSIQKIIRQFLKAFWCIFGVFFCILELQFLQCFLAALVFWWYCFLVEPLNSPRK